MKMIIDLVKNSPLFHGISPEEFEGMMSCLSTRRAVYEKDEAVMLAGGAIRDLGLVLSGGVKIIKEDMDGRVTLLTEIAFPDMFGEVFACAGIRKSPVTVLATEATEILFMDYKKIVSSCSAACPFHARLVENMLGVIARKNLMLNQKIEILSKRTTREKLLCFFDMHRGEARRFTIPYNREGLAHYLSVDRSAMSNELCKMRDEGMIRFQKSTFELLDD